MKTINKVKSGKRYKNQTLTANLELYSKEHDDTVTRKSADIISTKDKGSVFTNSDYERLIVPKGEKDCEEETEKYGIEDEGVNEKREDKNNSKITSSTKKICTNKIQKEIVQKKIKKRKRINEKIINNGNVWKKAGKRTKCERKNNTEYDKEKDSRTSSTKLCRMISKNIIIPSDDPT